MLRIETEWSIAMTTQRRTDFTAFVLDLLDFIEERIREAIDDEASRFAALSDAAGALPVLRDRLRENEVVQANFILVFGNTFEERWAPEWWEDFAKMERAEFEKIAHDMVGPEVRLSILRRIVADTGAS